MVCLLFEEKKIWKLCLYFSPLLVKSIQHSEIWVCPTHLLNFEKVHFCTQVVHFWLCVKVIVRFLWSYKAIREYVRPKQKKKKLYSSSSLLTGGCIGPQLVPCRTDTDLPCKEFWSRYTSHCTSPFWQDRMRGGAKCYCTWHGGNNLWMNNFFQSLEGHEALWSELT